MSNILKVFINMLTNYKRKVKKLDQGNNYQNLIEAKLLFTNEGKR